MVIREKMPARIRHLFSYLPKILMPCEPKANMASQASAKRDARRRVLFVREDSAPAEYTSASNLTTLRQGKREVKKALIAASLRFAPFVCLVTFTPLRSVNMTFVF